jgi:hypothetical protein
MLPTRNLVAGPQPLGWRHNDPPREAAPMIAIVECLGVPGPTMVALSGVDDEFSNIKKKCPRKYSVKCLCTGQ